MKALIVVAIVGLIACLIGMAGAVNSPTGVSDTPASKVISNQVSTEQADEAQLDTFVMIGAVAAATS